MREAGEPSNWELRWGNVTCDARPTGGPHGHPTGDPTHLISIRFPLRKQRGPEPCRLGSEAQRRPRRGRMGELCNAANNRSIIKAEHTHTERATPTIQRNCGPGEMSKS